MDVFNFPQARVNNTYQLADNLTFRNGNHSFTFGGDFRRTELHSDLPRNARPLLVFNGAPGARRDANGNVTLNGFVRGIDLAAASAPSGIMQTVQSNPDSTIDLRYYQYNFFGQDDWRVRPNISLSLGLRYEYNTPVGESHGPRENTFTSNSLALVPGLNTFLGGRRKAVTNRPGRISHREWALLTKRNVLVATAVRAFAPATEFFTIRRWERWSVNREMSFPTSSH